MIHFGFFVFLTKIVQILQGLIYFSILMYSSAPNSFENVKLIQGCFIKIKLTIINKPIIKILKYKLVGYFPIIGQREVFHWSKEYIL